MTTEPKTRRPANTAFKQQRLKAWQPILTPKTVLPAFIVIGILFAPLGGLFLWASDSVAEIVIDYTKCSGAGPTFVPIPNDQYTVNFPGSSGDESAPQYMSVPGSGSYGNNGVNWVTTRCTIKFNIPDTMKSPIFVYYRLTHFYQNHRRYIKSMDIKQLGGTYRSAEELKSGGCDPMSTVEENGETYPIYPCGLIANSIFNDSFALSLMPADANTTNLPYNLTDTGIAWKDGFKYGSNPYTNLSAVKPPPNWAKNFPNGYTNDTPPIDVTKDEHFQVWMRTSGLPNFRKMYAKNEEDDLPMGTYTIDIDMNYNVSSYGGTKSLVISTVSFMGGRNPFLGIAYVVVGVLCVLLGLLFTARHLYKPKRLGDHTYLSWNQNAAPNESSGNSVDSMDEAPPSATATGASARY
ncbi:hypothetical protein BGZ80_000951 [Entomortierella chlamydospora]|uniref:Lem3 cdc50 family protein n=1 Tax=Entomortierella chlamydospora TaxID=101097 RepID=A0A9P6T3G4_9FUNG|nr:hypothetical protein BGZ79_007844 [Entomortierella chlamydospora]KAG0022138.1 hypothetical protein BGZ80_000951 [Entomortierella chlamydospora]